MKIRKRMFAFLFALIMSFTFTSEVLGADYLYYASTDYDAVATVQRKLKNWGYYTSSVDGIFGYRTEEAVKYFQRKNGLTADGKVGNKTKQALGMNTTPTSSSSSSSGAYTTGEINLIAKAVYGEARGESYTGQVAVAAVILNRVESSSFPNTVSGVIYQNGAFDAVSDGQINLTPNETALKAARDAAAGWDPSNNAIYYYNPKTATNSWIRSRPIVATIGSHVFCK